MHKSHPKRSNFAFSFQVLKIFRTSWTTFSNKNVRKCWRDATKCAWFSTFLVTEKKIQMSFHFRVYLMFQLLVKTSVVSNVQRHASNCLWSAYRYYSVCTYIVGYPGNPYVNSACVVGWREINVLRSVPNDVRQWKRITNPSVNPPPPHPHRMRDAARHVT